MVSYAAKNDAAGVVMTGVKWTVGPILLFMILAPVGLAIAAFMLIRWLASPRGRWCLACAWWAVRHPRAAFRHVITIPERAGF